MMSHSIGWGLKLFCYGDHMITHMVEIRPCQPIMLAITKYHEIFYLIELIYRYFPMYLLHSEM